MENELKNILNFFETSSDLKLALRYSRLKGGRQESSADHSWQLSLMVPIVVEALAIDLDVNKAVSLAIIHDLPESITGDIDALKIANNEISKEEKKQREESAMTTLVDFLPSSSKKRIADLWNEYENNETVEAKFVKALDKLETTFQLSTVSEYWDHPDFIVTYPDNAVKNFPQLLPLLKEIKLRLKKEFNDKGLEWKEEFNYGLD